MGVRVAAPMAVGSRVSVGRTPGGTGAGREQALTASNVTRNATDKALRERECERVGMRLFYRKWR